MQTNTTALILHEMVQPLPLGAAFLEGLGESSADLTAAMKTLEGKLEALLEGARAASPNIDVRPSDFARHLGKRISGASDPREALEALHSGDLYVAYAATQGNPAAFMTIEQRYFSSLHAAVERITGSEASDDVIQSLRHRLFLSEGGAPPKIAEYTGAGSLASFLRVTAVRMAISARRGKRQVGYQDASSSALEELESAANPELEHFKARYKNEFQSAFQAALGALSPRERNLLRQHFLDGLTIDLLGEVYRVHRSTVARWIARARETILEETRRRMIEELGLTNSEFTSLTAVVQSQIDLSIHRFLGRAAE